MAKIDVKGQLVACKLAEEFNKEINGKVGAATGVAAVLQSVAAS